MVYYSHDCVSIHVIPLDYICLYTVKTVSSITIERDVINKIMEHYIISLYQTVQSPYFLFSVLCFAIGIKLNYVVQLISTVWKKNVVIKPLLFLLISMASALICDIAWLIKLSQSLFVSMPYYVVVLFIRIAWAFLAVQYQSLALFLQALTQPQFTFKKWHTVSTAITGAFFLYFIYLALFHPFTLATTTERDIARTAMDSAEFIIMRYIIPVLVYSYPLLGLAYVFKNMRTFKLPKLLRKQVQLFTAFFVMPYLAIEFILATCFASINDMYLTISISTLLLTLALYYCMKNVLKIRLANATPRVIGMQQAHVIDEFKTVLRGLSEATNTQELTHITQLFFNEAFAIPRNSVRLTIREHYSQEEKQNRSSRDDMIEAFMADHDAFDTLLVRDEVTFSNFYEPTPHNNATIQFLNDLQADVFLSIHSNKKLVGYITVDHNARLEHLNHSEQDAMLAFATYLGNVTNLLRYRTVNTLLSKEKKLKDSLYNKHQEINLYKESVHGFLRHSKRKMLGIIFYKNGHFNRANTDAKKLIPFDPNLQEGHPLSKSLQEVAQYVETFSTPYSLHTKDSAGNKLLLSGVPHLEQQHTIITASYPDISDVILQQMHLLHDPNDWDYLLYLSSTKAGSLINAALPSNEETVLNTKIKLLKAALNKKAVFLNVPEEDIDELAKLIHAISMRETLHTLTLTAPTSFAAIAPTLFGSAQPSSQIPLLSKLSNGTLSIKNVHHLDNNCQQALAELISFGWYRYLNSEQTASSNTRIVCSSNQILSPLVHSGRFNTDLYTLLKKETVTIPSVASLPAHEQESLIDGFTDQYITSHALKNMCALSQKEKQKIIDSQPVSMLELQQQVQHALQEKTASIPLEVGTTHNASFEDPELLLAGRLGKQALKHEHIMELLWKKFKNQNKIALFLGVNRSSVNRRFKAFHIGNNSEGVA